MAQYAAMPIKIMIKIIDVCSGKFFFIFIENKLDEYQIMVGITVNLWVLTCMNWKHLFHFLNEKKNPVRSTSAISRTRNSTDSVNTFPSIPRDVWAQAMSHQMHLVVGQVSYIVQLFDKASDGGPDHSGISRSLNVVYVVCAFRPVHSDNIHIGLQ